MSMVGRFDAYVSPVEGNWRVRRCLSESNGLHQFTNWAGLDMLLVAGV
jgi:hypothetical protein